MVRTEGGSAPREIHFTVTPRKDAVTGLLAIGIERGAAAEVQFERHQGDGVLLHQPGLDAAGAGDGNDLGGGLRRCSADNDQECHNDGREGTKHGHSHFCGGRGRSTETTDLVTSNTALPAALT